MTTDDVLEEFRGAGALREGHFVLASGRHSPIFLQKNLVFQYADRTERLCRALADQIVAQFGKPDVIVAPALFDRDLDHAAQVIMFGAGRVHR